MSEADVLRRRLAADLAYAQSALRFWERQPAFIAGTDAALQRMVDARIDALTAEIARLLDALAMLETGQG